MRAEMPGLSLLLVTLWPSASPREESVVGGFSSAQQVLRRRMSNLAVLFTGAVFPFVCSVFIAIRLLCSARPLLMA